MWVRLIITTTTLSHRMTFNYIFFLDLLIVNFSLILCKLWFTLILLTLRIFFLLFLLMWHVCIIRRLYFKFVHIANFFYSFILLRDELKFFFFVYILACTGWNEWNLTFEDWELKIFSFWIIVDFLKMKQSVHPNGIFFLIVGIFTSVTH